MNIPSPNRTYIALVVVALGIFASTARANPIPITGFWNLGDDNTFFLTGPSLILGSWFPAEGGPGPTVVSCPGGSCVLPPQSAGPFGSGQAEASGSGGTFDGVTMYDLTGSLGFAGGTYKMPGSVSPTPSTISPLAVVPFRFAGTLVGYSGSGGAPSCCPFVPGFPPVTTGASLFTFALNGSGSVSLSGYLHASGEDSFTLTDEQYNFSGTATVTPEPATFVMFGFELFLAVVLLWNHHEVTGINSGISVPAGPRNSRFCALQRSSAAQ